MTLDCGHEPSPASIGTGYGTDNAGRKHCYACCAEQDKQTMRDNGRIVLYLSRDSGTGEYIVTNWPGTLRLIPYHVRQGRHNIARTRHDVWFNFEGARWHGVQYGDNTQLCHCRKTT
jgi:hypothetical protein